MKVKKENNVRILHTDMSYEPYVGELSLARFYEILNCDCVQYVRTHVGNWMVIDENGKLKGLKVNRRATIVYNYGLYDTIVGDVIFIPNCVMKRWEEEQEKESECLTT